MVDLSCACRPPSDEFLVFLEVQESDEGAYYCNLTSPLEQISSSTVDLTVWSESHTLIRHCV